MKQKTGCLFFAFSFVLSVLLVVSCNSKQKTASVAAGDKPNVIFIFADDLGYGDLGCYGQEMIQTPNIDALAAEGMLFTQHYAGCTVCAPSRSSLVSGMHTGHSDIRGNKELKPIGQQPIEDATVTVGEIFKQAGYATAAMGKWGMGAPGSTGDPQKQGFDKFFGYYCQRNSHRFYPPFLWRNGEKVLIEGNHKYDGKTFSHDLVANEALGFIKENAGNPFFLYLAITLPHVDLAVPQKSREQYLGKFEETPYTHKYWRDEANPRATYAGMVSHMDRDIGRITALLKELNIDENTLVIFSSDNGPEIEGGTDCEFFNSNGPLRGFKRDVYEGGIRVPFIAKWPAKVKAGTISDHISAFWDFLPTACDITGIDKPEGIDGISYLPELLGEKQAQHEFLYWEFHEQGGKQAVRMGDWKGVRISMSDNPNAPVELYNLKTDIEEQVNVAADNPEIVNLVEHIMEEQHTESDNFKFKFEKNTNQ